MVRSWSHGWAVLLFAGCALVSNLASAAAGDSDSAAVARAGVAFPSAPVRRWQVGLLRPDRLQHASLAMTLGFAAGLVTRSTRVAGWSSLSLGLVKELLDINGSGFDPVDLSADAAGAAVAAFGTHAVVE